MYSSIIRLHTYNVNVTLDTNTLLKMPLKMLLKMLLITLHILLDKPIYIILSSIELSFINPSLLLLEFTFQNQATTIQLAASLYQLHNVHGGYEQLPLIR